MKSIIKLFSLVLVIAISASIFMACDDAKTSTAKLITNSLNDVDAAMQKYSAIADDDYLIAELVGGSQEVASSSRIAIPTNSNSGINRYINKISTLNNLINSIKASNEIVKTTRGCIAYNIKELRVIAAEIKNGNIELTQDQKLTINETVKSVKDYADIISGYKDKVNKQAGTVRAAKGNTLLNVDTLIVKYENLANKMTLRNHNASNLCNALQNLVNTLKPETVNTSAKNAPEKSRHYIDEKVFGTSGKPISNY